MRSVIRRLRHSGYILRHILRTLRRLVRFRYISLVVADCSSTAAASEPEIAFICPVISRIVVIACTQMVLLSFLRAKSVTGSRK